MQKAKQETARVVGQVSSAITGATSQNDPASAGAKAEKNTGNIIDVANRETQRIADQAKGVKDGGTQGFQNYKNSANTPENHPVLNEKLQKPKP